VSRHRTASRKTVKTRRRKITKGNRSSALRPARSGNSFVADLQEKLERQARELEEAHDQQAATAEVLRVISSSKFDLQPVLDTLLETAVRLCGADIGVIRRRDGDSYPLAATFGYKPEWRTDSERYPSAPTRGSIFGRTVIERQTVHVPDVLQDQEFARADTRSLIGFRAALGVPLLREGNLIGIMAFQRFKPGAFTPKQIGLVETFAAQAVIAIENVRLFEAEQQRTRELSESLEQQTATSQVLKVISSSPADLQPVFEAMLANATRLCEAKFGVLYRSEGDALRAIAMYGAPPAYVEERRRNPIVRAHSESTLGRAIATKRAVQIADVLKLPAYFDPPLGYKELISGLVCHFMTHRRLLVCFTA
jgi:hypothetical protein